ncbi:MAG: hypothetical protein QIT35_gp75 [Methanophagales virus PBV299]|uniref:Uncharacterized protein n=1 Tax=Methanophagales virus PBV299 TaxID=2987730 RepID=A0ABY6GLW0_9CAUD|nr:MAG: hypothetical protein QIT35_gp75 [Methanophagales virus PBV299]UYL64871.1 MAG: hypothetical protein OFDIEDLO_00075 [Methanophagales virus PBV299]
MSRTKKHGVEWIKIDDLWFAVNPTLCGIFCGVTEDQLNDQKYLRRISANKEMFKIE